MQRRQLLTLCAAAGGLTLAGCKKIDGELWGQCPLPSSDPQWLLHPRVQELLDGLDMHQVWDSHVHLVGSGDSVSGIYINPAMQSLAHPLFRLQYKFYMNSVCADEEAGVDASAQLSLLRRLQQMPDGFKAMVMAFDAWHDDDGAINWPASSFHIPDAYAAAMAARQPDRIEWIASIHPYRHDALEALQRAISTGARAIKWLPPSQNIDPASARCEEFYAALARAQLPLIVHTGDEHATPGNLRQEFGNPLRLRRALSQGVRVVLAHCATLGQGEDLDNPRAPARPYIDYFARLMDESAWQSLLMGDLSAVVLTNRDPETLQRLLHNTQWHARLLQASDYPLPAVMPVISLRELVAQNLLEKTDLPVLMALRRYNPLLFDLVLKRALRFQGMRFADAAFHTRIHFEKHA